MGDDSLKYEIISGIGSCITLFLLKVEQRKENEKLDKFITRKIKIYCTFKGNSNINNAWSTVLDLTDVGERCIEQTISINWIN